MQQVDAKESRSHLHHPVSIDLVVIRILVAQKSIS